jgi:trafficking protein particle complex subunit 3
VRVSPRPAPPISQPHHASLPPPIPSLLTLRGYNIGTRLVDEYLAKTRTTKCGGFPDAMAAAARGACRAFLGVPGVLSDWSPDGTEVTLSLPDNPLADGVELPSSLAAGGLWYSNLLAGALRGALAQVNLAVETAFISDPLLLAPGMPAPPDGAAAPVAAIRVRLVGSPGTEAYPFKDED